MSVWLCFVIEVENLFMWCEKWKLLVKSKNFHAKFMKYEKMKNKKWLELCDVMRIMK